MPTDDLYAVGLDVGGTKVAGGLVRFPAGAVVARRRIPTRAGRDAEGVLADAIAMARDLSSGVPPGGRFAGVGVGVPELVDLAGRLTSAATIDWRGIPLADKFSQVGPVWVEADVRAAALAEARFGAGRLYRLFAYVSVGTGISHTLVQDGRPYAGARGNALVLASGPTSVRCSECGTWSRTVLEEVASGPALAAAAQSQPGRGRTVGRRPGRPRRGAGGPRRGRGARGRRRLVSERARPRGDRRRGRVGAGRRVVLGRVHRFGPPARLGRGGP